MPVVEGEYKARPDEGSESLLKLLRIATAVGRDGGRGRLDQYLDAALTGDGKIVGTVPNKTGLLLENS